MSISFGLQVKLQRPSGFSRSAINYDKQKRMDEYLKRKQFFPFFNCIRYSGSSWNEMECFNCSSLLEGNNDFFLLKCGHSLCKTCSVTDCQDGHPKCFNCKMKNSESALDTLPKHLFAYSMLTDTNQLFGQSCVICEEFHPATKFCLDCNEAFCDPMAKSHSRQKKSRNHRVVTTEEFDRHRKNQQHLNLLHHKSCVHHMRPFEFLDLKTKTHNKLLCSDCLTGEHTSLTGLGDCASTLLPQKLEHIRELGSQGTAHLVELREEEDHFTSRLKGLEESRDRSLSEIRRVFGSLHEALQTRQSELEREVEELSKSAGFELSEERERSRVWQGQLCLLGSCVEEINSHSIPASPNLNPKKRPLPPPLPSPESPSLFALSEKALMVDACLLEDALRSSLSSSRASSSLTDVQSRVRVSKIRDQIEFSFQFHSPPSSFTSTSTSKSPSTSTLLLMDQDKLEALLHHISSLFTVTSTSSLPPRSDWSKNKVQSVMTFYSRGHGANQLSSPCGMTYSPELKLFYVCDSGHNRIQVFRNHLQAEREGRLEIEFLPPLGSAGSSVSSSSSDLSGLALNPPYTAPPTALSYTQGLCYHDGQLFIADHGNNRVQVWRAEDGSFLRTIGTGSAGSDVGQFLRPNGCTVYQNHLFVSDSGNNRIQKFSLSDFSVVKVIGSKGTGLGQLSSPMDLSIFNGKLYVADYLNSRIYVFDHESGAALSVIGPSLSLPRDERLSLPVSLVSSHDLLFVSNEHRVLVFDSDHNYLYSFGSYGSGAGQFSRTAGMVMVNEKLFVVENSNHRVQVMEQRIE